MLVSGMEGCQSVAPHPSVPTNVEWGVVGAALETSCGDLRSSPTTSTIHHRSHIFRKGSGREPPYLSP